jgi:hypothetical protein
MHGCGERRDEAPSDGRLKFVKTATFHPTVIAMTRQFAPQGALRERVSQNHRHVRGRAATLLDRGPRVEMNVDRQA